MFLYSQIISVNRSLWKESIKITSLSKVHLSYDMNFFLIYIVYYTFLQLKCNIYWMLYQVNRVEINSYKQFW